MVDDLVHEVERDVPELGSVVEGQPFGDRDLIELGVRPQPSLPPSQRLLPLVDD